MARPTYATINLGHFRDNYLLAQSLAPNERTVAIIKANAYGHGAINMANAIKDIADAYGVACIEEAIELRDAGIKQPILLLEGFFTPDELAIISKSNFWCVIHNQVQIKALDQQQLSKPISVWLKMDTGMHRVGLPPSEYNAAYTKLKNAHNVKDIVLMSHFACADDLSQTTTKQQMQRFENITKQINAPISLANSAATLSNLQARKQFQRPGIMLYGASPFNEAHPIADQLKPVMSLTSQIISIRDVPINEGVGYGFRHQCEKPTKVGTVAIGYADGYPRHAKEGTPIMVNGQKTKLIGRVSMDMLMVDLTHIPNTKIGDAVELWGENICANTVAQYCDTIPYTLFTGVTNRVNKIYKGNVFSPNAASMYRL